MRVSPQSLAVAGCATLFALTVIGCSNDSAAPSSMLLTQAQADSIGEELSFDAEDEISGATASGATAAGYSAAAQAEPASPPPGCMPARSPASPTDTDADGVPDSVRLDFTSCVYGWPLETDTIRGTVFVLDPTRSLADHAVERIFGNLVHVRLYNVSGKTTSETRNGTRMTSRDSTALSNQETNFRTDYVFRDGGSATHVKTWTSNFTADVAGSIQKDQALPSGLWSISGTSSWTRGPNTYSLTVTTSPALHYNAGCTSFPRFDAGALTAVVSRNGQTMHVTIAFTACGQAPTITRS
ncbi:MAG TPA: hypothetical protein VLT79_05810 [Gemmatimonadales bacterium]|nr:hypothetical protein [Gemmatimonadales bacterium]